MQNEIQISPEHLLVAQTYLKTLSTEQVAQDLRIPIEQVSKMLDKREVKAFIDTCFLDIGYNNRFKLADTFDRIIEAKLLELEETEMTSTTDIAKLLEMKHKMNMDLHKMRIEEIKAATPSTAVQVNNNYGENFSRLLQELMQ
jgi:hypothetical protein